MLVLPSEQGQELVKGLHGPFLGGECTGVD